MLNYKHGNYFCSLRACTLLAFLINLLLMTLVFFFLYEKSSTHETLAGGIEASFGAHPAYITNAPNTLFLAFCITRVSQCMGISTIHPYIPSLVLFVVGQLTSPFSGDGCWSHVVFYIYI